MSRREVNKVLFSHLNIYDQDLIFVYVVSLQELKTAMMCRKILNEHCNPWEQRYAFNISFLYVHT